MSDLFDPDDPRPIHFLGISGAGVSALAMVALRRGIPVTGTDPNGSAFPDLRAAGAVVHEGSDPALIRAARAVVHTAAAHADHPELVTARELGIPVVPRKRAVAALVAGSTVVGIAGTHGKTTTTVMTTEALRGAGLAPSALAGGRVTSWGGNAWLEGDGLWVVEADEYDKAFLDLTPTVAVINNVESDHLECYGSVANLEAAYASFAEPARLVLIGTADEGSNRVAAMLGKQVLRFGLESTAQLRIKPLASSALGSSAQVTWPDGTSLKLDLAVPGVHNIRNAVAALGVVHELGGDFDGAARSLAAFNGVGRRFERGPEVAGVAFVDDYAHHPTEVVVTIAAARQAYPDRRLVAVFQPHLYSRTRDHHAAMGEALAAADVAVITDIYPAREEPIAGVSGQLVFDAARSAGVEVIYQPDRGRLDDTVAAIVRAGDLCLTLGAGDVTTVGAAVRDRLASQAGIE